MMSELSLTEVLLRISLVPALVVFLFGAPAGLAALPLAWRGKLDLARSYAWFSLKVASIPGLWMAAVTAGLEFRFSWIFVAPAVLSATALAHAHYYQTTPRLARHQFTIPMILYATLAVALVAAGVNFWNADYADYTLRDEFATNLARMKSISNVNLHGSKIYRYEQEVYVPYEIEFSLAGRPDTLVKLFVDEQLRTCDSDEPLSKVVLHQVGRVRFEATAESSQTGSPIKVMGINVGPAGAFAQKFPFPLRSIDDIADHYDEMIEILKKWPREDQPGELSWEGYEVKYWAID